MIDSRAVLKIAGRYGTARGPEAARKTEGGSARRSDRCGQFLSAGSFETARRAVLYGKLPAKTVQVGPGKIMIVDSSGSYPPLHVRGK